MRLKLFSKYKYDTETYIKVLDYLLDLVKEHNLSGMFINVNIIDFELATKHNLAGDDIKKRKMPTYFFGCVENMTMLGVLEIDEEHTGYSFRLDKGYLKRTYTINKIEFLVFYSLMLAINDFKKKKSTLFNKYNCMETFLSLFTSLITLDKPNKDINKALFNSIIERAYGYIGSIFNNAFYLNKFAKAYIPERVYEYLEAIENNKIKPLDSHYKTNDLSASWFTEFHFGKGHLTIKPPVNNSDLSPCIF